MSPEKGYAPPSSQEIYGMGEQHKMNSEQAQNEWDKSVKHLEGMQVEVNLNYDDEGYVLGVNFVGEGSEKLSDEEREKYENTFKKLKSVIILGK